MATWAPTYAPTTAITQAPTTEAGATVAFNANGSCTRHPDILLRKKRAMGFGGWKILLPVCPRCQADWEDERRLRLQQQQQQPAAAAAVIPPVPPPPPTVQRQRPWPPPVQPLAETGALIDMRMSASTGQVGLILATLQMYMGSAKVAGAACEFLWQMATLPQNVPILQQCGTAPLA
jgi:hypothetical protein